MTENIDEAGGKGTAEFACQTIEAFAAAGPKQGKTVARLVYKEL